MPLTLGGGLLPIGDLGNARTDARLLAAILARGGLDEDPLDELSR